jgi:hypothetical protein
MVVQSQFVDPLSGKPLIFDKRTNSYRPAEVEGGGVAPRPVNPSATEREKTAGFEVIKGQLDRIEKKYKPQYVGIVSGQIGRLTQLTNANEAEFRQIILDVKDSLLRARSGAQINEQEYARLSKLVPDFSDSNEQFQGKMKAFRESLNSITQQRLQAQQSGGVYTGQRKNITLPDPLGIR